MTHLVHRRASFALLTIITACVLAACGSSSSGSSPSTTTTTSAATATGNARSSASRSAFRQCLAQHGVTLPSRPPGSRPPGSGAGGPGGPGFFGGGGGAGGLAARNPKLAAAMRACGGGRFFRGGRRFRLSQTAITKYVACVRQHGYNLPDPNFSGKGPVFPAGIRTDPKFQAASRACQNLLLPPAGGPGEPAHTTTTS